MLKDKVFWYEDKKDSRPPLDRNRSADVAVVGGGMAGLMCAYDLARAGRSVILLEKDFCGAGASGKSSGFISPDSELELSDLLRNYGRKTAEALWNFNLGGIAKIKNAITKFGIECDYQDQDSCYIASTKRDVKHIRQEHKARELINQPSPLYHRQILPTILGSRGFFGGVRYADTYGINGFLFCQGLAKAIERTGVLIFEQSPVKQVQRKLVLTGDYSVNAETVVLCTDRFLQDLGFLKHDLFQLQTFLAISKPLSIEKVEMIFPEEKMMVWDSKLVYHYFRITGNNRMLLGGANMWHTYTNKELHDPQQAIKHLDKFFKKKFPQVDIEWDYLWPGMVGVSKDILPIAGGSREDPSRFYIAGATGLSWAAALSSYISDKIITGKTHSLDDIFSPDRTYRVKNGIQRIIGKPLSFLLSHFISKYLGKL